MKTVVTKLRRSKMKTVHENPSRIKADTKMGGRIEELTRAIEMVNRILSLELEVEETLLYEQMLKNYKIEFELLTNKGASND